MKQWLLIVLYMLCVAVLMYHVVDYARNNPMTEEELTHRP